ncbi:MAG: PAS domain-containing protein [Pyrinomonadaceae bacterium]|nr:PAS domain-containing protein [Pyrinomonadaceae bacterium]
MSNGILNSLALGRVDDLPSSHVILMAALNALPDAIYFVNERKTLTAANDAATAYVSRVGESLKVGESLIGKRCCEMFWRTAGSDECVVDRSLETGERVEVEILARSRDGRGPQVGSPPGMVDTPTLVIVQPLLPVAGPRTVMVIARDISDLRRAESDALAQRSFMASIADRSPDEIYALDIRGRITWMNERSQADSSFILSGRYFVEFIAEDSRATVNESLRLALEGQESQYALRALRADGTLRDAEIHTSPFWKEGNVSGVLVFLRDVTER